MGGVQKIFWGRKSKKSQTRIHRLFNWEDWSPWWHEGPEARKKWNSGGKISVWEIHNQKIYQIKDSMLVKKWWSISFKNKNIIKKKREGERQTKK